MIKRETNREGFAEYFARQLMYSKDENDKAIQSTAEFLPNSKEIMDEIFTNMRRK